MGSLSYIVVLLFSSSTIFAAAKPTGSIAVYSASGTASKPAPRVSGSLIAQNLTGIRGLCVKYVGGIRALNGLLAAALLYVQQDGQLAGIGQDENGFLTIVGESLRDLVQYHLANFVVSVAA